MTEIWNLSSLCRCCHSDGTFKSLYLSYEVKGQREQYAVMLKDTFGIVMDPAPPNASAMVCDDCIYELKKATRFKAQVLDCERKFAEYCLNEQTNQMDVKIECESEDNSDAHGNTDDWPSSCKIEVDINIKPKQEDSNSDLFTSVDVPSETEDIKKDVESVVQKNEKQTGSVKDAKAKKGVKVKDETKTTKPKPTDPSIVAVGPDLSKSFDCKECGKPFKKLNSIKAHMRTVHSKTPRTMQKCHFCDEEFPSYRLRSKHSVTHFADSKFECQVCGKTYTTLVGLETHMNEHTKRKIFICDYCNKEFVHKNSLLKHIQIHMGTRVRLVCDLCGVQCNDSTQLRLHTSTVHEKLRPFGCQECDLWYATKRRLKYHVMQKHTGEMPYKCEVCAKHFPAMEHLRGHQKSHSMSAGAQTAKKVYTCPHCETKFESKSRYLSHRRTFVHLHLNKKILEKNLRCEYCDRIFENKYSHNRHMNLHLGIKNYSCQYCDKKFIDKGSVARHIKRHEAPADKQTCTVCLRKVRNIEKHMKGHVEKPYECQYCNRSYPENNTLTRHIKTKHLNIRPYVCPLCPAKFVRPDALKRHNKRKHNGVDVKPPPIEVDLGQIQTFKIEKV